jgi:hypothetical protein
MRTRTLASGLASTIRARRAHQETERMRRVVRVARPAHAFFLARLSSLAGDLSGLKVGDDRYDYFINVPASRLHVLSQQIADLEFDVQERYGVAISAMPIPIVGWFTPCSVEASDVDHRRKAPCNRKRCSTP